METRKKLGDDYEMIINPRSCGVSQILVAISESLRLKDPIVRTSTYGFVRAVAVIGPPKGFRDGADYDGRSVNVIMVGRRTTIEHKKQPTCLELRTLIMGLLSCKRDLFSSISSNQSENFSGDP